MPKIKNDFITKSLEERILRAREMQAAGMTYKKIGAELGVVPSMVSRYLSDGDALIRKYCSQEFKDRKAEEFRVDENHGV